MHSKTPAIIGVSDGDVFFGVVAGQKQRKSGHERQRASDPAGQENKLVGMLLHVSSET